MLPWVSPPVLAFRQQPRVRAPAVLTTLLTAAMLGCQDSTPNSSGRPLTFGEVRAHVVGEAAAGLQPNGEFSLRGAGQGELSSAQAITLAEHWPLAFGQQKLGRLQKEHGDTIELASLRACGRTYYARTAVEPLPKEVVEAAPAIQRVFGGHWLVTLCSQTGVPQIILAVAALSTDLRIENGQIVAPTHGQGNWFHSEGIRLGIGFDMLEQPERLVQRAGTATGRRIVTVPDLVTPLPRDASPMHPRWLFTIDAPIGVRSRAGQTQAIALATWRRPGNEEFEYQIPLAQQPKEIIIHYPDPATLRDPDVPIGALTSRAHRRTDTPTAFETVVFAGGN